MNLVKGRTLILGQEVEVYYNLHKKVFSIRDKKTKLVVAHARNVNLENVIFKVNQKAREKVLREKRKNVHAFVQGTFKGCHEANADRFKPAYYNPHETKTFIDSREGFSLSKANSVYLENKQIFYI